MIRIPGFFSVLRARRQVFPGKAVMLRYLALGAGLALGTAQAGVISGTVYDIDNDLFLDAVRLTIPALGLSTTSERGGHFRLTGVPEGTHTLVVSASGFPVRNETVTIQDANGQQRVNIHLSRDTDVVELDTFVVEGSLIGTARAIDVRRASREFREVVSSDAAGQFTDRNPAEALQRVAGITVESDQGEGNFIIVRGGAPELSAVQIDGVSLATPEEDGRRVNLNVITVDQLERIEVSKTWLPSQKGNVIGGTVNLITRSALDRGRRFASIEAAGTYREHQSGELSYRGAVTFGDVINRDTFRWLGDGAIGLQFSLNNSRDFSGSDTVTWGWNLNTPFPFLTRPDEQPLRGFALQTVNKRNFNIERERQGASVRLEYRVNENHEFFVSASYNRFDDTVKEHIFSMSLRNTASQFYSGTTFFTAAIAEQLGADPTEPFNAQRLALSGSNLARALTFNEAIQLGELGYDPDLRLFTRGGLWGLPMDRDFSHTLRRDRITTYQVGGRSRLPGEVSAEWRIFGSDAKQDAEQNWMRLSAGVSGLGAIGLAGPDVRHPFLFDPSDNPLVFRKGSFSASPTATGAGTVRQLNFTKSRDERLGGDLDLRKRWEGGGLSWDTQAGLSLDRRDKVFEVDRNSFGIRAGGLDRTRWPQDRISLDDTFFDGGEINGFGRNFGPDLPFGPSFNETNTLAFLRGSQPEGVTWSQIPNHVTNNVTSRATTNYEASEDITGIYLQQTVYWRDWTVIGGFRFERTENTFTNLAINPTNPDFPQLPFLAPAFWNAVSQTVGEVFAELVTTERDYDYWLPALHVIRRVGEDVVVRGAVTRTIARPLFSDLIPREVPSISGGQFQPDIRLPAFDLRPMESINYDISVDYYFASVGLFSASAFYKDLDGPIYDEVRIGVGPNEETAQWELKYNSRNFRWQEGQPIVNDQSYTFRQKRNAGSGSLYGVEFTFNRRFDFLNDFWNGFGINSNIAWFNSRATLVTEVREGERVNLFKQPSMTANLSLFYEKHGLFARLSYNVRGSYLDSISAGQATIAHLREMGLPPDAYDTVVDRRSQVDLTLRYRIRPSLQVFAEANNLTNEPLVRLRRDASRPQSMQYTGRLFTVGLKWSL